MVEEILNIIIKVVAALLALGAGWVGKWLVNWLKGQLDEKKAEKLDLFVAELVAAAEQQYKDGDTDGQARLNYVQGMLVQAGYEITEAVRASIEAKVFEINVIQTGGVVK